MNNKRITEQKTTIDYSKLPSLCKANEDYFRVAVGVEPRDLIEYQDLILTQFNDLTTENRMKPTNIHPYEDVYSWAGTDAIVDFAEKHNMKIRSHGLVYEKVMASWFFKDENGNRASKELVMDRLEKHVKTIVGRYKGKIHSYDIVNEVFGHEDWDTRDLTAICGIGFVPMVYKWAHEADPDAILILNDNFHDIPKKRENIFRYVKQWIEEGVPIHGVGFQDHLFLDTSLEAVEETLKLFSSIPNLKIYITELDISPYTFEDRKSLYPEFMIDEILELMAKKYGSLFDIYRKYADHIETVGFWNVCDARTWLDEWFARGRKHYGLPFGYEGEPREYLYRITDIGKKLPRWEKDTKIPPIRNNNYKIESDVLAVRGFDKYERFGTVKAELYSDFGETKLIASEVHEVQGEYEFAFRLDGTGYDGKTSPDYIITVTENDGKVKTDKFTYYTREQKDKYYTITDDFRDFSKTYYMRNCEIEKGERNSVKPFWFWGNGTLGEGKIVYNIPQDFTVNCFEVEMKTRDAKYYHVYYSEDDENYTEAKMEWSKLDENYVRGIALELPGDTKYIMINISKDMPTYWRAYECRLTGVKLYTNKKGE